MPRDLRSVDICITIIPPSANRPSGYLGAIYRNHNADPGEDWLRGSDLADGSVSVETRDRILAGIRELLPIPAK